MRARHLTLLVACALTACGPPEDATRLVLLDEAARMAGALVQLEHWEGAPAFAIRLTPDERPLLVTQNDARRLEVPAHSLAYLEGADAQVRVLDLDRDVARDGLSLTGAEGAARQVARLMDAELVALDGDRFQLTGANLLDHSAFLETPRGLREVRPIENTGERLQPLTWKGPDQAEAVPLRLVGVYGAGNTLLVVDAESGFTLLRGCVDSGAVRGTAVRTGDQVRLVGEDGHPLTLRLLDDGQLDLDGELLTAVMEEP